MQRLRCSASRIGAVLALAALLLLPLLLRAHHGDHANARPCATCVVAKHSPAVGPVGPAGVVPVFAAVADPPALPFRPAHRERPVETGRGPPLPALVG